MANFLLHKGNYTTIGVALTDYDGNPDLTTAIVVSQTGSLVVEPVSSGATNRSFYVSVLPGATVGQNGVQVNLSAQIPATGSGAGAGVATKVVTHMIDAIVPIDHREAVPVPATTEQPLPHP